MDGKKVRAQAPDGFLVLTLSERLGQMPEQIEQMDQYWFDRWIVYLEGESIYQRKLEQDRKKLKK